MVVAMLAGACSDDAGDDGAGGSGDSNGSGATATATASGTTSGGGSSDDATEATTDDSTPGSTSADTALPTGDTTDGSSGGSSDSTTTSGSGSTGDGTSTGGESSGESSSGGAIVNDDPFDPASCGGTPISLEDATALLAGMDRQVLANATIQVRERTCPGGACGAWGEAYDWVVTYLTWSGGVTTAYKDFQADMQLVVFDDQGTTRLSLQHVTFDVPSSTYDDEDGMLYDIPSSPISYPHVRAYDDDPDSEYYYQELDWQVRDGVLTVGEDCVRWVADPYVQQPPFTEQYAVVFHW
jgi:hypothetical protein